MKPESFVHIGMWSWRDPKTNTIKGAITTGVAARVSTVSVLLAVRSQPRNYTSSGAASASQAEEAGASKTLSGKTPGQIWSWEEVVQKNLLKWFQQSADVWLCVSEPFAGWSWSRKQRKRSEKWDDRAPPPLPKALPLATTPLRGSKSAGSRHYLALLVKKGTTNSCLGRDLKTLDAPSFQCALGCKTHKREHDRDKDTTPQEISASPFIAICSPICFIAAAFGWENYVNFK